MRGGGNMQQMMKQMQKMQKKMAQEQEKLKEERVAGTAYRLQPAPRAF